MYLDRKATFSTDLLRRVLILAVGAWALPAAGQGVFSSTARPAHYRQFHTATLLPDGRVFVVGGLAVFGTNLASAELFDPGTQTWSEVAPLPTARASHTATLLANGKVLVAGGTGVGSSTADLYDPATGTWTAQGSMGDGAFFSSHTATLLSDGRVLLRGGTIARLYDPALSTWSSAGTGLTARSRHAAALLPDGRVLVVGGLSGGVSVASAEIYNPSDGTWTPTGSMSNLRREHSLTLLPDGRVLAVGGRSANLASVAAAEIYTPGTGLWTSAGTLAVSRGSHSATLLPDGNVLVAGGLEQQGYIQSSAELYNPGSGIWSNAAPMTSPRMEHTATLLADGRVLVANGGTGVSADLYYPTPGAWASGNSMSGVRGAHTATMLEDGRVLVAGGAAGASYGLTTAERYNSATGTWSNTGSMATARHWQTATRLQDGRVLVTGGALGNSPGQVYHASCEIYDPSTGLWSATGSMGTPRYRHSATLLPDGRVLVVAGRNSLPGALSSAEVFNPATGTWAPTSSTTVSHEFHSATLLGDGRVLVFGGSSAMAELYDSSTGTWASAGFAAASRFFPHTATRLRDGTVLFAGGQGGGDPLPLAELYDPSTGTWANVDPMTIARAEHEATLLPDGRVLITGGRDTTTTSLSSTEIYDPSTRSWAPGPALSAIRVGHTSTLLVDGRVLVAGGGGFSGYSGTAPELASTQLFDGNAAIRSPAPAILSAPASISTAVPFSIDGNFRGDSEAGGGGFSSSAVNYPIVEMRPLDEARWQALRPSPRPNFWDDPMTLSFDELPPLEPGVNLLRVTVAGVRSATLLVDVQCGVAITAHPQNVTVGLLQTASFSVRSSGGLGYQWYRDGVAIPGAIGSSYTTPLVQPADSGLRFHVQVTGACPGASATSNQATLTVADSAAPVVDVLAPTGGEYWLLSPSDTSQPQHTQILAWSMTDDIRICQVDVSLLYSNDGGASYLPVPAGGGLPASYGPGGTCAYPGVATASAEYTVPRACSSPGVPAGCGFPSGFLGSLYRARVTVTDQAGNQTTTESANPFYIVQPNPDTVRTLILKNTARMQTQMGVTAQVAAALSAKLQELSNHPRVQGFVVDLNGVTSVNDLYAAWDADPSNPDRANQVLFGCHAPLPPGCAAEKDGIHDLLRSLLQVYTGVKHVVVAGDDRIIPFARLQDHTVLFPEQSYTSGLDLTPTGTTVGQALAANKYLSDDPLGVMDPVSAGSLSTALYIPDLPVGRLVETPEEITTAIATFISQDGVLDLSVLDPTTGHKVLLTGYDFLTDSAKQIRSRWKSALGADPDPNSLAPVDGRLVEGDWGLGSVSARVDALEDHLSGNGGSRYGVSVLSGHANHYQEGVPGTSPFDIQGLSASNIVALNLAGGVVYAVGCHGGLPVPGSNPGDADHSLDLPQAFLSRGVVAYVANTGYGWGLKHGVGYGERLVQLLTEEMTRGGTVVTGEAVKKAKQKYYLESPRFDVYDQKSLMQWTLFGLPMYGVKTGLAVGGGAPAAGGQQVGPVRVKRSGGASSLAREQTALPSYLTQLNLHFDFTAPGVYRKWTAGGDDVTASSPSGCPDANGCYYTLNGLVERAGGMTDLPVQPYFIYDSRLSGTSQHGVLWKGGVYDQETGWVPIVGELQSNGGDGSDHGPLPEEATIDVISNRHVPGQDPESCRPSDLELNSLVVNAGEALKHPTTGAYSIERRYREIDLEVFYFNNTVTPANNCDRTGPAFGTGPYHGASGTTVEFAVPVTDASGVWRVLVVYNKNQVDASNRGRWEPLELADDAGTWRGSVSLPGVTKLTFMLQALDNRGNVSFLRFESAELPASGVPLGIPQAVRVSLGSPTGSGSILDYDEDDQSDLTVFQTATATWQWRNSSTGATSSLAYGGPEYTPVPGDYDGDGVTDLGVYHPPTGLWFIRSSTTGTTTATGFGGVGYAPVRGDFDGDAKTDLAVFHDASGLWFIKRSSNGVVDAIGYGVSGYVPVPADYDGDGKTDLAVYHPPSGLWFTRSSLTLLTTTTGFGSVGYKPVRGDYDADGRDDIAVYHEGSGLWFVKSSIDGTVTTTGYGGPGYVPVPGRYDEDPRTDIAVYHAASGLWYTRSSLTGATTSTPIGGPGFIPVN